MVKRNRAKAHETPATAQMVDELLATGRAGSHVKRRSKPLAVPTGDPDNTADRLLAYLASIRPMRGVADLYEDERYQRGRSVIERLALNARGSGRPTLRLSVAQCADLLHFIGNSEPIELPDWWQETYEGPSHIVGFYLALEAVEDSLRVRP